MDDSQTAPAQSARPHAHMIIPPPRMRRRRNRGVVLAGVLFAALAVSLGVWRWLSQPVPLTVVALKSSADEMRVLNAFARVFADNKLGATLRVTAVDTPQQVVETFLSGKADLAVVRTDADLRGQAASIAVLRKNIILAVAIDPKIKGVGDFRGRRIGVVGHYHTNDGPLRAVLTAYDMTLEDIERVDLTPESVARAIQDNRVDALFAIAPLFLGAQGEGVRSLLKSKPQKAHLLEIDQNDEVARERPAYETFDIPANTFGPQPEEETASLVVNTHLVAKAKLSNDVAALLARQFLSNRQGVIADAPTAAQIEAPSVAKDAFLRVHPGVGAYIENNEQSFFDKYGDFVYIFMAIGGVFGSAMVALRRSIGPDRESEACDLVDELVDLRRAVRVAIHESASMKADKLGTIWVEASNEFELMLGRSLPLIADHSVEQRTVQALGTALAAAERAIAELAPLALRRPAS